MDSGVSPIGGEQDLGVWNGHRQCACYHLLLLFNQFGDLERCALHRGRRAHIRFSADAGFANPEVYESLEG